MKFAWGLSFIALACSSASPRTATEPPVSEPQARDNAPSCTRAEFTASDQGVSVDVGGTRYAFSNEQELGDYSYNYTTRTVRMIQRDSDQPHVQLEASCYSETDCNAPDDEHGNELWCLVSHVSVDGAGLFPIFERHDLCRPALDFIATLVTYSQAPTCFRAALGTYPGHLDEYLGELAWDLDKGHVPADEMIPLEVVNAVRQLARDADTLAADHRDRAAAKLEQARELLALHLDTRSGWTADVIAQQALARVTRRYPYTLVGPENVVYDLTAEGDDPWGSIRTVSPPWDGTHDASMK